MKQKITLTTLLFLITFCLFVGCKKTDDPKPIVIVTDEMIQDWIGDMNNYGSYGLVKNSEAYQGILNAGNQAIDLLMESIDDPSMGMNSRRWSAYLLGVVGFDRFNEVLEFLISVSEVGEDNENVHMWAIGAQAMQGISQLFLQQKQQFIIDYIINKNNHRLGREAAIESITNGFDRLTEIGNIIFIRLKEILLDSEEIDKIREVTAWALYFSFNEEDEAFVIDMLENHPNGMVKHTMANALGEVGGSDAIESLGNYGLVYVPSFGVRERSARSLGELGSKLGGEEAQSALKYLNDALETEEVQRVIDAIYEAIAAIEGGK